MFVSDRGGGVVNTLSRLQPGMVVRFEGRPHRVSMVNDCRARLQPVAKRVKTFVPAPGKSAGQRVQVASEPAGHNVSPNAELPIVAWKGDA